MYCFQDWHLLPYFVDALLGICVFFSGSCLLCWCGLDALDRGMVYRPLEEGRGGWAGLLMPSQTPYRPRSCCFEFPQPLEVTDVRFEEVPGVG